MIKKLIVVMALAFTLSLAQPVGEARAATNTAVAFTPRPTQVDYYSYTQLYGPDLLYGLEVAQALPGSWWGWTKCVGSVMVWGGTNALVGLKVAAMIKKAGSIRAAIMRIQRVVTMTKPALKRTAILTAIVGIGGDILGLDAVIGACFSN